MDHTLLGKLTLCFHQVVGKHFHPSGLLGPIFQMMIIEDSLILTSFRLGQVLQGLPFQTLNFDLVSNMAQAFLQLSLWLVAY